MDEPRELWAVLYLRRDAPKWGVATVAISEAEARGRAVILNAKYDTNHIVRRYVPEERPAG